MTKNPDLSIVVPFYNEEDSARPLHAAVTESMSATSLSYELILVDDGSRDATFATAADIAAIDPRVRVIKFRRNYGQTPAMAAGIDHARGGIIVTMDGDLQNDPADIPLLVEKLDEGYEIVVGWRHNRQDKLITRKIPSIIANWLIGKVTGVPIKDNGCSLKAYRADIIKQVPLYSEMHRFIPAMASITGARVAEIKVRHHARQFGESKYGLSRVFKVLADLLSIKTLVSFSTRPMHWFGLLALPAGIGGLALILGTMFKMLTNPDATTMVTAAIGILLGMLAFFLIMSGALAELIIKTGSRDIRKLPALTARYTPSQSASGIRT